MKKIINSGLALSVFLSVIVLASCRENPVDKQLDKIEAMMAKVDKLSHEENPSHDEIINFKKDATDFQQSLEAFQQSFAFTHAPKDDQLTASQKKRFMDLLLKQQSVEYKEDLRRLHDLERQYNLNY
jgi:hypothetical protein